MGGRPEIRPAGEHVSPARLRYRRGGGYWAEFYDTSHNGTGLAALFELSLAARIHINDALSLRLAYQFTDITGMALAPRQLGYYGPVFGHGGNLALDGLSIGLQASW